MDAKHKAKVAKEFLDGLIVQKKADRNRMLLYGHLDKRPGWENSKHHEKISQALQEKRRVLNVLTEEVTKVIEALPDTRGKTALYLHYLEDEPYKCLAIEMQVSERQIMRDVHTALVQIGENLLATERSE